MSDTFTDNIPDAVQRVNSHDPDLKSIDLDDTEPTDSELNELIDCLLAHPDVITELYLGNNHLTDQIGAKLADYVAAGSTIQYLDLSSNQFSLRTYMAFAAALRINTSLQSLFLFNRHVISLEDKNRIDAAFVDALIVNPNHPDDSIWNLYKCDEDDECYYTFQRLKTTAEESGHPSTLAI
jgi:Leucine-rich repeat (LRR) protein